MAAVLTVVSIVGFAFSLEEVSQSPFGVEPSDPQSITLGAVHTGSALVHDYETAEELERSRLADPGLSLLISAMNQDDRMRLTVDPAMLGDGGDGHSSLLIVSASPVRDDAAATFGGHTFLVGSVNHTDIGVEDLKELGVSASVTPTELVRGFVCGGCSLKEGRELARRMSLAEASGGAEVVFFARQLDAAPSATGVMYRRAQVIERWHFVVASIAAAVVAAALTQRIWDGRESAFRIDQLAGATAGQVWWRAQGLLLVGATLPAVTVVLGLHALMIIFDVAGLLAPGRVLMVLVPVLAFHAIATAYLTARVRRLSASLTRGDNLE
ncbi:hypothetical protein [Tessaracoccus aquimaris]|nr:hypothetical protein [Tessaracoccus aquimaris]